MDKSIKIASVQMHVSNDNEKNLQTMEDCLKHIDNLFKDIDLVVFPELCSMSLDQTMEKQAEKIPGLISNLFSKWAKKYNKWLIPGSVYEKYSNKIYNSTPVLSPSGKLLGVYRKRYPWSPYEKTSPGQTPFTFKIKGVGTIGLMICYDMWFPEVARDLTNLGAEVIIVPTMTTTGDRLHEQIISQSIAITHQCYLISCNGVGIGGVGGSQIVDPEGMILQRNGEGPVIQTAIIDFDHVKKIREKGIAGITNPHKAFKKNKQYFKVYNK